MTMVMYVVVVRIVVRIVVPKETVVDVIIR